LQAIEDNCSTLQPPFLIWTEHGWNQQFELPSQDYFDILVGFPFC
jgi:hypothetical protein